MDRFEIAVVPECVERLIETVITLRGASSDCFSDSPVSQVSRS